jgi:hypothetical protein
MVETISLVAREKKCYLCCRTEEDFQGYFRLTNAEQE